MVGNKTALMRAVAQEVVTEEVEAVPEEDRQQSMVSEVALLEGAVLHREVLPLVASDEAKQEMAVSKEVVPEEVVPEEVVPEEVSPTAVVPKVAWHAAAQAAGWSPPASPGQKRERPTMIEKEDEAPQWSRLASVMGRFWYSLS